MADTVSVFSRPGQGTVSLARLAPRGRTGVSTDDSAFEIAAVTSICPGERECGDAWAAAPARHRCRLFMVDGSGHGAAAAAAARVAVDLFESKPLLGLSELAAVLHRGLGHTRGAAAGIAEIDRDAALVRFAGLGNIAATLIAADGRRGMVSTGGTLGHTWHPVKEFTYRFAGTVSVILHTDGIATRWQLDAYPGLEACHAGVIAAVIHRDFRRGRDDAAVLVTKVSA